MLHHYNSLSNKMDNSLLAVRDINHKYIVVVKESDVLKEKQKKIPVLKRLMPYAGNKAFMLYLAMLLSATSGIMVLMPMVYIHKIISGIVLGVGIQVEMIKQNAIYGAAFAASGLALYLGALILSHLFAFEVEDNIIKLSVKKMMNKPLGYFANKESGKIRNVIVSGAAETHTFLAHQLPDMAMTMIPPLVLLVFFFVFDWKLGLVSLAPMLIGMGLMATMMTKEAQKEKEVYYSGLSTLSAETVEYVRGIPVVKTFAQSIESFDRLYSLINKLRDLVMKMTMRWQNKMSIYESVVSSTAFFLVPVAILLINNGGDIRQVIGNSIIYFLIGPAFGVFIMRSAVIAQYSYFAEVSLDKIDDILDYKEMDYGNKSGDEISLEFKNVSFAYEDNLVVDDVSFNVKKGETVALVGPSGGGKTTIAKLAARFYDSISGEILIGGVNIKEYNKERLMNKVSFVFQNSKLFKMSLRDNLLIGKANATDEEIKQALLDSSSKEIVDNLKDGLSTVYGAKGTYFSGGESQRLLIARAFLKNAQFLILDEATAFADPENEQIIQESLKKLSKDKTTLMIAHRLSTIIDADRILVVDKGKIVEEGKHEELLNRNGEYRKLWEEYQRAVNWKIGGQNE